MDHLCFYMIWEYTKAVSVQPYLHPPMRWAAGLQWLLLKTGVASRTQDEAVGFMRSRAGIEHPGVCPSVPHRGKFSEWRTSAQLRRRMKRFMCAATSPGASMRMACR